ncbi:MAG: polysaccharide biosynthesis protein [Saprospiraceae bacterium]|nr:polysaccharide biosynthesis protein [Saprospiraceae bacterium]
MLIDLPGFIAAQVTGRHTSLFHEDFEEHQPELLRRLQGKGVLVIGGAGTIGTAFIKALMPFQPARVLVVDHNENGLTELVRDLRSGTGYEMPKHFLTYAIDFGEPLFEKLFLHEGPFEVIAHFAAHKHVRSEKDPYSIEAMINNNVFKTKRLLELASKKRPEHFFCVSTDKAADPSNIMGASKKLMEHVIAAYAGILPVKSARFANVAFSNGSLLAGFVERWMKQQPLSAPSDIKRYFVSPEESGQLCLLCCALGQPGDLFFPVMDAKTDTKSFSDIALYFLHHLGFTPEICTSESEARSKTNLIKNRKWPVYFFKSDTSGEKTIETFFTGREHPDFSQFKTIGVIPTKSEVPLLRLEAFFNELTAVMQTAGAKKSDIVNVLSSILPEFQHIEKGKHLDERM